MNAVQALHTAALAALILVIRRFAQFFSGVARDRHLVIPGSQLELDKSCYFVTIEAICALTVTTWVPLHRCSPKGLILVGVVGDGLIYIHVGEV